MVPIHNHSEYSALDGFSTAEEIAQRLEEIGAPGAFLTDHGTVAGYKDFRAAMKQRKLFAGYGMEAYQARTSRALRKNEEGKPFKGGEDSFHLVLLAKTTEGLRNLMRLSDLAHRTGFYYYPRLDWELLEAHSEGVVATTACMGSLVNQSIMANDDLKPLDKLTEIFGADLFVEIHTYHSETQRELNKRLAELAQDRGLPLLYANDAHYARKTDYEVHELWLCAQMGQKKSDPKGRGRGKNFVPNNPDFPTYYHPACLYIMDEDDVRERLSYLPEGAVQEAIDNSEELYAKIEKNGVVFEGRKVRLPQKFLEGRDASETLDEAVVEGLKKHYFGEELIVASERAEAELNALETGALGDALYRYFLIVKDYIDWAKSQGIMVGPGRGSVGGSVMAYALGITNVDPLKHPFLSFERFFNAGREEGLPDIDTDFEKARRKDVFDYLTTRYKDVLHVGNHMRLRPKQAIQKMGTALYGTTEVHRDVAIINKILKPTDHALAGKPLNWSQIFKLDPSEYVEDPFYVDRVREAQAELKPFVEKYKDDIFKYAGKVTDRISTYGVHASAIVLSDEDLGPLLPARSAKGDTNERVYVTQAEMRQVEKEGFPKFDFLGLTTLDHLARTAELTGEFKNRREIVDFFWNLDVYNLPEEAYQLIDDKRTLGLFQIDNNHAPRQLGQELKPRILDDLALIVALNNPGPQRTGVVDRFLVRRSGEEEIEYTDPILVDILERTMGEFVYQEQVLALFYKLGYDLGEGDKIRKMLGKKLFEEMDREYAEFERRCLAYGLTKARAKAIWDDIVQFSFYGFNEAHAVEYGTTLAWTLYAKYTWPTQFIMAGIEINPTQVGAYVSEAERFGIAVLPPDVNRSNVMIDQTSDGSIIYGLRDIKGIGTGSAKWVVQNAPWEDPIAMLEAIVETDKPPCNQGHFRTMMDAGAFDSFGYRLVACETCGGKGRQFRMVPKKSGDGNKKEWQDCETCAGSCYMQGPIPGAKALAAAQKKYLGIALTGQTRDTVLEKHAKRLAGLDTLDEFNRVEEDGTKMKVPGVITEIKTFKIRADAKYQGGREMARATITWDGDECTFVAFPDELEEYGFALTEGTIGEFTLVSSAKGPRVDKVFKLS